MKLGMTDHAWVILMKGRRGHDESVASVLKSKFLYVRVYVPTF